MSPTRGKGLRHRAEAPRIACTFVEKGISCRKISASPTTSSAMDDLDFKGWNNADWNGVFADHHTEDVLVDWKGQEPTHGIHQHIEAMKAYVEIRGGR